MPHAKRFKVRKYTLADCRENPTIGWVNGHHVGVLVSDAGSGHFVIATDLNGRAKISVDHRGQTHSYTPWYGEGETVGKHCASWARMAKRAPEAAVGLDIKYLVTSVGADIDLQVNTYFAHKYGLPGARISGIYLDGDARRMAVSARYLATLNI